MSYKNLMNHLLSVEKLEQQVEDLQYQIIELQEELS